MEDALVKACYAALFIGFTVFVFGVTLNRKRSKLPPGPYPWPLLGNLLSMGTHPHQTYQKMAEKYGNIFTVYFGSARAVVVTNGAMAKELFTVSDAAFANRPLHDIMYTAGKYFNPDDNTSLSISRYTPKVREMRQICDRQLLAPWKVEATRFIRREEVWRTVGLMEKVVQAGKLVDVRPFMSDLAVRLSCRSLFNRAFMNSEVSEDTSLSPEKFHDMDWMLTTLVAAPNPADVIPSLKLFGDFLGINKQWKIVFKQLHDIVNKITDFYRKEAPNANLEDEKSLDFLEILLKRVADGTLSESNINALNLELMMAGADTVSASMEWTLLQLVRHPNVMQKVRTEIDAKFGENLPVDEVSASELPYFQAVIKESLRLHHPAPISIPHSNVEDAKLAGYQIPAGTSVLIDFYAIQRNPEQWGPDAAEFRPERFIEKDMSVNGSHPQYIPFGAGRRICPGRTLAMRNLTLTIGALVHAFDWSASPEHELSAVEATGGLNLRNQTPLILQSTLRPQASLYH